MSQKTQRKTSKKKGKKSKKKVALLKNMSKALGALTVCHRRHNAKADKMFSNIFLWAEGGCG